MKIEKKVLKLDPKNLLSLHRLQIAYWSLTNWKKANFYANQTIKYFPKDPYSWLTRAIYEVELGDPKKAISIVETKIKNIR